MTPHRPRAVGLTSGSLWRIAAGSGFALWSLFSMGMPWTRWAGIGLALATVVLVVAGAALLRASLRLPRPGAPPTPEQAAMGRRFAVIVGLEFGAIFAVNAAASITRRFELIPSLDLIVVGLHFLPLARLFRVPRYYALGALFCLLPLGVLAAVPAGAHLGRVLCWYVLPSLGCGLAAMATAVLGLREVRRSLAHVAG